MRRDSPRTFRDGVRGSITYAPASVVFGLSFGAVATDAGFPAIAAFVMSAVVFAGSAQFTAVEILAAGGGVGAAVTAAALMNSRFLPMGLALGASLNGGPVRRAIEGQAVVGLSWVLAARGDGFFDRSYLFGHVAVQYAAWVSGTAVGVLLPALDIRALGLDVVFPAFFVAILAGELSDPRQVAAAVTASAIALSLVPVAPPGVPILLASTAALIGLRAPRSPA